MVWRVAYCSVMEKTTNDARRGDFGLIRKSAFAALSLLLCLSFTNAAFAAQKLLITDSLEQAPLGKYLDLLEDPDGKLTINEVSGAGMKDKFTPGKSDVYSMGFTKSVYWLRMEIEVAASEPKDVVIEMPVAWFDNIKIYLPFMGNVSAFFMAQSGDRISYYQRNFPHRDHIFTFTLPPGTKLTAYMRAETEEAMVLPFFFRTEKSIQKHDEKINLIFGLVYGLLLALMVYNLYAYYLVQDKSRLYYALHILGWALLIFSMNGSASQLIWPDWPYWGNRAPLFGAVLACLFAGVFTREFFETKKRIPKFDVAIKAGIGFCIFMLPFSVFWPFYRHAYMLGVTALFIIYAPLLFAGAALCHKNGARHARFYLLAWPFPMLATVMFGLGCFNILPFNFFAAHAIDFGASIEALILSLALADRVNDVGGKI